jgi:hypothetical protein
MNNIFDEIEKIAEKTEANDQQTREQAISTLGGITKSLLAAAVPFAAFMLAAPNKMKAANSGVNDIIIDTLNFALTLEYLESSYYTQGVGSSIIPQADIVVFQTIQGHETQHVAYLQNAITGLGGTYSTAPTFDFTAGGMFTPFSNYQQFLDLSQAFEDTGVRAYKGQAANLVTNLPVLTAALQIHSVEARHACEVRRLRTSLGNDNIKGWITGANYGTLPSSTAPIYAGEDNISQGGLTLSSTIITSTVPTTAYTEAFDEPLSMQVVLSIVQPFL